MTHRYSLEVDITRIYRDLVLDETTLRGYYALARVVAPFIERSKHIKRIAKNFLVDRLIDGTAWALSLQDKPRLRTSRVVTDTFLRFCYKIGRKIEKRTTED